MAISNNYTMTFSQIRIRRKITFCRCHVRCRPGVHVPWRIRLSKAESMKSCFNISWAGCICIVSCLLRLRSKKTRLWWSRTESGSGPIVVGRIWRRRASPRSPLHPRPRLPLLLVFSTSTTNTRPFEPLPVFQPTFLEFRLPEFLLFFLLVPLLSL